MPDDGKRRAESREPPVLFPLSAFGKCLGAAGLIGLFLAQSAAFIFTKSFTWDETQYVGLGQYLLSSRPWTRDMAVLHPPLPYYLSSVGLIGITVPPEVWEIQNSVECGQAVIRENGDQVVYRARLPMLALGMVVGITLFTWSRRLFGLQGAFLSLTLFAISPNLIAHQSLITPDFTLTTFFFLTGWCFYRMTQDGGAGWVMATGVSAGLTILSKFTGLFLLPVGALWVMGWMYQNRPKRARRLAGPLLAIGLIAAVVVMIGYQFQLRLMLDGIRSQYRLSSEGWPAYLLGEVSSSGWPHYYLIALLVKVPVPVIVLTAVSVVSAFRARKRPEFLAAWVLLVPVVFFFVAMSLFNQRQIGFRYVLPAMPFLLVWLGQTVGWNWPRWKKAALFGALLLWQVVSVGRVAPHYLAYFNEMAGGPENGYHWLGDSNLDWGQDLKGLKQFLDRNPLQPIVVSYFGTMPMDIYGMRNSDLPAPTDLPRNVYVAISVTKLQGIYEQPPDRYRWLLTKPLVKRIGYSIHIYRL